MLNVEYHWATIGTFPYGPPESTLFLVGFALLNLQFSVLQFFHHCLYFCGLFSLGYCVVCPPNHHSLILIWYIQVSLTTQKSVKIKETYIQRRIMYMYVKSTTLLQPVL